MKHEDPKTKCAIAAGFITQFLIFLGITICWGLWMVNAIKIDSEIDDYVGISNYYDVTFTRGPFDSSDDDYAEYWQNYHDYCDDREDDCYENGTRWLIVYKLCFAVTLIFTINACIMTLGAWSYPARMLGSCLFGLT